MRARGLDGRDHVWKLGGRVPLLPGEAGSAAHARARALLAALFPLDRRLEEVGLPGTGGLRADFFLPGRRTVLEVHGRQHYEFVPHFHGTRAGFWAARVRDQDKREFCDVNGLRLVELPHDEPDGLWRRRILGRAGLPGDAGGVGGGV